MSAVRGSAPGTSSDDDHALELRDVYCTFGRKPDLLTRVASHLHLVGPSPIVRAVDGVSLSIHKGDVLGLVGESGCGKSTLGRIAAGVRRPTAGKVLWRSRDVATMGTAEWHRAKLAAQIVFQNPYASLNPRMQVADIVGEAPRLNGQISSNVKDYVDAQLQRVGMDPGLRHRYPHQLSGGQRQRVGIARALAVKPELLVCDEAIAALDVSIQAQIINLFMDLRQELSLTYLFISHDLSVVEHVSDCVAVMYLGRIVEQAVTEDIYRRPNHPYTQALLAEAPTIDASRRSFSVIKGELPSPLAPPPGCHFHLRCPHAMSRCQVERPALKEIAPGHLSACHLNG